MVSSILSAGLSLEWRDDNDDTTYYTDAPNLYAQYITGGHKLSINHDHWLANVCAVKSLI